MIEIDVDALVCFRSLTGQDLYAVLTHLETAAPDIARPVPRVPCSLQRGNKLLPGKARALFDYAGRSIESGVASQIATCYLLINHLGKTAI